MTYLPASPETIEALKEFKIIVPAYCSEIAATTALKSLRYFKETTGLTRIMVDAFQSTLQENADKHLSAGDLGPRSKR